MMLFKFCVQPQYLQAARSMMAYCLNSKYDDAGLPPPVHCPPINKFFFCGWSQHVMDAGWERWQECHTTVVLCQPHHEMCSGAAAVWGCWFPFNKTWWLYCALPYPSVSYSYSRTQQKQYSLVVLPCCSIFLFRSWYAAVLFHYSLQGKLQGRHMYQIINRSRRDILFFSFF